MTFRTCAAGDTPLPRAHPGTKATAMRFLYAILIYSTMVLAVATVWAVGRDRKAQSDLQRAQELAAIPQFNHELAAAAAPAAAHPAAAPSTRPTSSDRERAVESAKAAGPEPEP